MIKNLRKLANWLERLKCNLHNWWNTRLESMKSKCVCENLEK